MSVVIVSATFGEAFRVIGFSLFLKENPYYINI